MLPKSKRLKTADFKALRRSRTFHTMHFFVRASPAATCRIAAVVSTAVSPKAVVRNAVRRRIYSAAAHSMGEKQPKAIIAISAKKGAEKLQAGELQGELDVALQKIAKLG